MRASTDAFETYLAPGESLVSGATGRLLDASTRSAGVVGLTDRRVLFVTEDDGFVDVAHEAVSSIRSRPRREFSYRELGPAVLAVLGAGVAVAGFVGVLALEPGIGGVFLALVAVAGVVAAELVRRRGAPDDWLDSTAAGGRFESALAEVEGLRGTAERAGTGDVDLPTDPDVLVLGIVTVALTAVVGLVAATESLLVVPLLLATVGGLALADYGYRMERDADRPDRAPGREVSVHLVDGSVVRLWVDPDARFERDLSAVVRESATVRTTSELARP